ncbi:MAG: Na+/H+ antiporter subunit E [Xanthomonadales bacterium]|nr:Na+/H+ antiporter subunit E [Xanthomonadales bacterium]
MIRRWLPYPLLSLLLAVIWLVLNQSLAVGTLLLGVLLGIGLGLAYRVLEPPKAHIRNFLLLGRLLLRVLGDIVRSNFAVARLIVHRDRRMHSGFVAIPLTLTDRHGLAVLAGIITSTPGTIWVSHDPDLSILVIHVLDLVDDQAEIDAIKQRYERPLLEIFQ